MNEITEAPKCRYCYEEIQLHAKKCKHCGSFQNWVRHIAAWNASLALMVALIAVSTHAIVPGFKLVIPKTERISLGMFDASTRKLSVVVTNDGLLKGLLRSRARLIILDLYKGDFQEETVQFVAPPGGDMVIDPDEVTIFNVVLNPNSYINVTYESPTFFTCKLVYSVSEKISQGDYDNSSYHERTSSFRCPRRVGLPPKF